MNGARKSTNLEVINNIPSFFFFPIFFFNFLFKLSAKNLHFLSGLKYIIFGYIFNAWQTLDNLEIFKLFILSLSLNKLYIELKLISSPKENTFLSIVIYLTETCFNVLIYFIKSLSAI